MLVQGLRTGNRAVGAASLLDLVADQDSGVHLDMPSERSGSGNKSVLLVNGTRTVSGDVAQMATT